MGRFLSGLPDPGRGADRSAPTRPRPGGRGSRPRPGPANTAISSSASERLLRPVARAQRREAGRALRREVPRSAHAEWSPAAERVDPVEQLRESNRTRVARLVPIRYGRMAISPFAFLRGAAGVMARDLAGSR